LTANVLRLNDALRDHSIKLFTIVINAELK
jgi:hypothetical protein